jgi:ribosomal protein S18 acetylase RimI-like enzyme
MSAADSSAVSVRLFRARDQAAARVLVEDGLAEHFGFVDRNANPDLVDIAASYSAPSAFFVAELAGSLVGTTGLIVEQSEGRLVRVAVARSHRRCGIATALLKHAAGFAEQLGLVELVAHTEHNWQAALRFYGSNGFVQCGCDDIDVHLRRSVVTLAGADANGGTHLEPERGT